MVVDHFKTLLARAVASPRWPPVRAGFIVFHVLGMVVLALPKPGSMTHAKVWKAAHMQRELAAWTGQLRSLGVDTDAERLEATLYAGAQHYAAARELIIAPFEAYAAVTGSRQGWQMFANPQQRPAEVHVDIERDGEWIPIYRPHQSYDWNVDQLQHNRMRKFQGRFARRLVQGHYADFTAWLARKAAADFPHAQRVRVRLWMYRSPTPAQLAGGIEPEPGRYRHERTYVLDELR